MKRALYIIVLHISTSFCATSQVITPFVHAISQRMYYIARLEKSITFLHSLEPLGSTQQDKLNKDWQKFSSFCYLEEPLYEKNFIKQLFSLLHECAVSSNLIQRNKLQNSAITTDNIAFRYYLTQRLQDAFGVLSNANEVLSVPYSHLEPLESIIVHQDVRLILCTMIKIGTIDPLLDEWDEIKRFKNLSDDQYIHDILLLTQACLHTYLLNKSQISGIPDFACLLNEIDSASQELQALLRTTFISPYSLTRRVFSVLVPFTITLLWAWGRC